MGDRMDPAAIMAAYGVTTYKVNPPRPSFQERRPTIEKYGIVPAGELWEWDVGPFCDETSCRIPYGVDVGNDRIPVNVLVAFRHGQITEIDVSFGTLYWDEIVPILKRKYGTQWNVERDPDMVITDLETKKHTVLERITLTHKTGGKNAKTNDSCQIWATNLDIIFQHHDVLGPFHSIFVIKLISTNF